MGIDTDSIELEDSNVHTIEKELHEYFCHKRQFSLKFEIADWYIEVKPYKNAWLVSTYYKMELQDQDIFNYYPEAVKSFNLKSMKMIQKANLKFRKEESQNVDNR